MRSGEWVWSDDDQQWFRKPASKGMGTNYSVSGPVASCTPRLQGLKSVKNLLGGKLRPLPPEEPDHSIPMGFHRP